MSTTPDPSLMQFCCEKYVPRSLSQKTQLAKKILSCSLSSRSQNYTSKKKTTKQKKQKSKKI